MSHRDELRRLCRIELEDGPIVRKLKAVLVPAVDLPADEVDLSSCEQERSIESPDVALQGGDLLFGRLRPSQSDGDATRARSHRRGHLPHLLAQFIFRRHSAIGPQPPDVPATPLAVGIEDFGDRLQVVLYIKNEHLGIVLEPGVARSIGAALDDAADCVLLEAAAR